MKTKLLLLILAFTGITSAQNIQVHSAIFGELAGAGAWGSANYQAMLNRKDANLINLRITIGYFSGIEISHYFGKCNDHFETGLGISAIPGTNKANGKRLYYLDDKTPWLEIAYRHQKPEGKFLFKASGYLAYVKDVWDPSLPPLVPFAGISFGYIFNKKKS